MGVSKIVKNAIATQNTRVGTPLYLSPELVKQKPYDYKIDVWAMGCILYQMCTGKAPFTGENLISLGYSIVHNQPPSVPSMYSTELSDYIVKLLEKNPTKRPSASEAYTLITQFKRLTKNGASTNVKHTNSRDLKTEPIEKKQIVTYGNGILGLVEKDNMEGPDNTLLDGQDKRSNEPPRNVSPRRGKLAKVLGKTDSKNLSIMNSQVKKESLQNLLSEKEIENNSKLYSNNVHNLNQGYSKKYFLDNSQLKDKVSEVVSPRDRSYFDMNLINDSKSKPKIVTSDVDISKDTGRHNKVSQRSEKASIEKVQASSFEAKPSPPTVPLNNSANYIKPARNIHSAYGGSESRNSSNRLVVNTKKMPDKIKCIELMLKRAILNDPVHNMLKNHKNSSDPIHNPYSPPVLSNKTAAIAFERQSSKDLKDNFNEPKNEKVTMGSLPTGAMELKDNAKSYQTEGITQEGTSASTNLVCHPFIDPFKKHAQSPGASKSDIRFLPKETAQMPENTDTPKREVYRAKIRPQTASANIHSRPSSAYSGLSGGVLGYSKDKIADGQQQLTDHRNYRIKTAIGSAMKDPVLTNIGYPKQTVPYMDKKVTIHDL
jgi:hypothetical protein